MQKVLDFHKRPFSSFSFTARELPTSKMQHNHHGYALDAIQDEEENPHCEARHHVKRTKPSKFRQDGNSIYAHKYVDTIYNWWFTESDRVPTRTISNKALWL